MTKINKDIAEKIIRDMTKDTNDCMIDMMIMTTIFRFISQYNDTIDKGENQA